MDPSPPRLTVRRGRRDVAPRSGEIDLTPRVASHTSRARPVPPCTRLYDYAASANCLKVRILVAQLGLDDPPLSRRGLALPARRSAARGSGSSPAGTPGATTTSSAAYAARARCSP